jgi:hypothetical protein
MLSVSHEYSGGFESLEQHAIESYWVNHALIWQVITFISNTLNKRGESAICFLSLEMLNER